MIQSHEFIVTRDLYDEVITETPEGEAVDIKLVKEDLRTKWFCRDITIISGCEQHYNEAGNIRTEYCKITVDGVGDKIIRMRYKDAKALLSDESYRTKMGYK